MVYATTVNSWKSAAFVCNLINTSSESTDKRIKTKEHISTEELPEYIRCKGVNDNSDAEIRDKIFFEVIKYVTKNRRETAIVPRKALKL